MRAPAPLLLHLLISFSGLTGLVVQTACGVPPDPHVTDGGARNLPPTEPDGGNVLPPGDAGVAAPGTVEITSPQAGLVTHANQLTVTVSSSGLEPEELALLVDGNIVQTTRGAPFQFEWQCSGFQGAHTLSVQATAGAQTWESQPIGLTLDHQPPRVVSETPTNMDQNVALHAPIQLVFSKPVEPGAVDAHLVLRFGGDPVARTVSASADRKTFTVTPQSPAHGIYDVLLDGLTDGAGNGLVSPPQWEWMVPAYRFFPGLPGGDTTAQAVVSPDGAHVFAVTINQNDGVVVVNQLNDDGHSWTNLHAPSIGEGLGAVAAAGRSGDLWLVIRSFAVSPANEFSYGLFHWTGNTWGPRLPLPANLPLESDPLMPFISMAAGDDGNHMVIQTPHAVTPYKSLATGGFIALPRYLVNLFAPAEAQVALMTDGSVVSLKRQSDTSYETDRWDPDTNALHYNIAPLDTASQSPLIARGGSNLFAVWLQGGFNLRMSTYAGGQWQATGGAFRLGAVPAYPLSMYATSASDVIVGTNVDGGLSFLVSRLTNGAWSALPMAPCGSRHCAVVPGAGGMPLVIDWGNATRVYNQ